MELTTTFIIGLVLVVIAVYLEAKNRDQKDREQRELDRAVSYYRDQCRGKV